MQRIYIPGWISLNLPVKTLMNTWAIMPAAIPAAMLPQKIPNISMTKGPKASEKLEKSTSVMPLIIKKPTKIRAGPVAASGMMTNRGDRKVAIRKRQRWSRRSDRYVLRPPRRKKIPQRW